MALLVVVGGCSSSVDQSADAASSGTGPAVSPDYQAPTNNPFRIGRPLIIPHGGGDAQFPEDTIYAYQHSIALGGDVVDADVQITADGIPVAIHDATLQRTTNGAGDVARMTYAQLATLDAGWGFERKGTFPFRGSGITIPTIEALLEAFPNTLVTLDLKDLRTSAVAPLCTLLRKTARASDVYIGVDTAAQVDLFRALCPEVHTSGTDAERRASRAAREANDTTFVTHQLVSQPEYLDTSGKPRITADYLAFSHSRDVAVLTYVVDDPAAMRHLIELGIDGIYTRRPEVMATVLHEMGFAGNRVVGR